VVRGYQFLTAPSLMHNVQGNYIEEPSRRKAPAHSHRLRRVGDVPTWVYVASLQRFWLDQITDWALVKPVRGLAHDLSYFDDHVVDRVMGAPDPAIRAVSTLAQLEEQMIGAHLDNESDNFAQGSGLAGKLTEWTAAILHWFEDRFVLRGVGKGAIDYGRRLGRIANRFEQSVLRPRYLVLFVCITLLVAF
jgi:hypothetical protein